jgi:hypothetical protein
MNACVSYHKGVMTQHNAWSRGGSVTRDYSSVGPLSIIMLMVICGEGEYGSGWEQEDYEWLTIETIQISHGTR